MGHEMHILEGFVLDSNTYGESGRILKILTKDFGVMTVVATGVRELKSKMRGSLDILQLVNFEFVEGKEVNRLTGIHEIKKFSDIIQTGDDFLKKRKVVSNIVNFILRTVVGETRNEQLWESFMGGMQFLEQLPRPTATPSKEGELEQFEILWLIKLLVSLGYWEGGKLDQFNQENIDFLTDETNKKETVEAINKAIKSTHL